MSERGFDDVMLLDFLFVAIKEREIKLRRVEWGVHSQCSAHPVAVQGL